MFPCTLYRSVRLLYLLLSQSPFPIPRTERCRFCLMLKYVCNKRRSVGLHHLFTFRALFYLHPISHSLARTSLLSIFLLLFHPNPRMQQNRVHSRPSTIVPSHRFLSLSLLSASSFSISQPLFLILLLLGFPGNTRHLLERGGGVRSRLHHQRQEPALGRGQPC